MKAEGVGQSRRNIGRSLYSCTKVFLIGFILSKRQVSNLIEDRPFLMWKFLK